MRLYLSSFRIGNQPQRLIDLVGENRKAAIVFNACDFIERAERTSRLQLELSTLQEIGFETFELDLAEYFGSENGQTTIADLLADCGLVWVRGGNSFTLRRAMRSSGFDSIITTMLEHDAIVYGGYSAGVAMLGPSLQGIELIDDPNTVPPGYTPDIIWESLGVLPYAVAPHYRSNHPESPAIEALVQYYIDNHIPFIALRDGEAIVVDGKTMEILS